MTSVGGLKTYRQTGAISGYHVAALSAAGRPTFHTRGGSSKISPGVGRAKKNQVLLCTVLFSCVRQNYRLLFCFARDWQNAYYPNYLWMSCTIFLRHGFSIFVSLVCFAR